MELTPRISLFAGLLAIIPGIIYVTGSGETIAYIALLNVLLIIGALFLSFSPTLENHTSTT